MWAVEGVTVPRQPFSRVHSPGWLRPARLSGLYRRASSRCFQRFSCLSPVSFTLGFLADFLSRTVLVGFLTGVGVQVAVGDISGMLGLPGGGGHL